MDAWENWIKNVYPKIRAGKLCCVCEKPFTKEIEKQVKKDIKAWRKKGNNYVCGCHKECKL